MKNKYQQFVEETGQILRFASWRRNNKKDTYTDTVNNTVKSCGKMFQPFLSSDEFYNDEETFWKCGDLWNEKPLLCPECREKENSKQ